MQWNPQVIGLSDGRSCPPSPDRSFGEVAPWCLTAWPAPPEISLCRELAGDEGTGFVLVMTQCTDLDLHRSRITDRQRQIPNWYELDWDHVQRARAAWETPKGLDLTLDAGTPLADNAARLRTLLDRFGPGNS
jgi:hypothetical protein